MHLGMGPCRWSRRCAEPCLSSLALVNRFRNKRTDALVAHRMCHVRCTGTRRQQNSNTPKRSRRHCDCAKTIGSCDGALYHRCSAWLHARMSFLNAHTREASLTDYLCSSDQSWLFALQPSFAQSPFPFSTQRILSQEGLPPMGT